MILLRKYGYNMEVGCFEDPVKDLIGNTLQWSPLYMNFRTCKNVLFYRVILNISTHIGYQISESMPQNAGKTGISFIFWSKIQNLILMEDVFPNYMDRFKKVYFH